MNQMSLLTSNRMFANAKMIKKINPKKLGYICPDGTINFQTQKDALEYAKNMVLQTLHSPKPVERGLAIKDRTIIKDVIGTSEIVDFGNTKLKNTIVVHGHPTPSPVSVFDGTSTLLQGGKSCIAINSKGEYSRLDAISQTWGRYLPEGLRDACYKLRNTKRAISLFKNFMKHQKISQKESYTEIEKIAREELFTSLQAVDKETEEKVIKFIEQISTGDKNINITIFPENIQKILNKIVELDSRSMKELSPKTHEYWLKNAEKYGLKYSTNYSSFL